MPLSSSINKIAIIGNAGGGKTTLARRLAHIYQLPLTHVDSIQFTKDLKIRPYKESIEILLQIQAREQWIIDGYGPLDILESRLKDADRIVFIDLPLWRHYWWATKRQIKNLWSRRAEMPEGSRELNWAHMVKLYKTLGRTHKLMRPELLRILQREALRPKVVFIKTPRDLKKISRFGIV